MRERKEKNKKETGEGGGCWGQCGINEKCFYGKTDKPT